MTWITTASGCQFYPLQPRRLANAIDILDIAHALSMKCRWGGHCREFYSVAEHSVRVSHLAEQEAARLQGETRYELNPTWTAIVGLLHDAAEAYIPDFHKPVKNAFSVAVADGVMQTVAGWEDEILAVVFSRLGIQRPGARSPVGVLVHQADEALLALEARDLMPQTAAIAEVSDVRVEYAATIIPVSQAEAKQQFIDRYRELMSRRAE